MFCVVVVSAGFCLILREKDKKPDPTPDPVAGEQWRMTNLGPVNPFKGEQLFVVDVIEVRQGWVQYRFEGTRTFSERPIPYFKSIYTFHKPKGE